MKTRLNIDDLQVSVMDTYVSLYIWVSSNLLFAFFFSHPKAKMTNS